MVFNQLLKKGAFEIEDPLFILLTNVYCTEILEETVSPFSDLTFKRYTPFEISDTLIVDLEISPAI